MKVFSGSVVRAMLNELAEVLTRRDPVSLDVSLVGVREHLFEVRAYFLSHFQEVRVLGELLPGGHASLEQPSEQVFSDSVSNSLLVFDTHFQHWVVGLNHETSLKCDCV